ncbi:MAG: hypothetical protein IJR58_02130 [Lachnospiraceae bacterium]|nr:hypothetical protein [Lachnospiraceae bacterium]
MSMTVHNEASIAMVTQTTPAQPKKTDPVRTTATGAPAEASATKALDSTAKTTEQGTTQKTEETPAAVYEKSQATQDKSPYKINRMSAEDRARIVQQLKDADAARQEQFAEIMRRMLNGQKKAQDTAFGFRTADAKTVAQAKADIGEDGYWGVKQTSQRLFDFASALAGDDVEQMRKMQKAMEKGFRLATGAWGKKDLPGICQATFDRANQLFEEYYKYKEEEAAKATAAENNTTEKDTDGKEAGTKDTAKKR